MREEDQYALDQISSDKSREAVIKIASNLADYLVIDIHTSQQEKFLDNFNAIQKTRKGIYPIPKLEFMSFNELVEFLRTSDDHIILMSIIWAIFPGKNASGLSISQINQIYADEISPTKDYIDFKDKKTLPTDNNRFGNSKTISSNAFADDKFYPYIHDIDYRIINTGSSDKKVKKFLDKEIPFIAGYSGMANMTCKVLSKLHIHPFSKEGKDFCEAMAAFIVGSGMHSYYEVYKSFNIYAKQIHYPSPAG